MTPDKKTEAIRYALLLNGSRFACSVLQALLREERAPALLVLPEYPPADVPAGTLVAAETISELQQLAGAIELDYAPAALQMQLAERLRRDRFEYLLVACWPYLLDSAVAASVSRYALNLHPSMLPAYRGADPIGAQLQCGEPNPGVSLHLLSPRFDRGDIVAQAPLRGDGPPPDRAAFERSSAILGARLFAALLDDPAGSGHPLPQESLEKRKVKT